MGCGCAGVERAALTIAAAGGGAKILGPQGEDAVLCYGAAVVLQGLAVECRGGGSAVLCTEKGSSKGRAELSGCTLTSPEGQGLWVVNGSTATMDGGSISGSKYGVYCISGSTATVRPPAAAPSAAPPCPLRTAGAAAFLGPVSPVFFRRSLARRNRRDAKMSTARDHATNAK
eukprot:COSAG04_NODE_137_length_23739_cov_18.665764_2_plen_173_part_00